MTSDIHQGADQLKAVLSPDDYVLEAVDISKHFDGVFALNGVDLKIRSGEIHALLGENGAGKSTLIKILTGVLPQDSGSIVLNGVPVEFKGVNGARRAGVVALYQELSIVPGISVAENISLGDDMPTRTGLVDWTEMRRVAQEQLGRLNQGHIPVQTMAGRLTPVQQTMVAVARAIRVKARVLILDEPTASLTDVEIQDLFRVLRRLRAEGVAIIYVSHRLEEVFTLCDRVTIMRNGQTVATSDVADTTIDQVISTMVGRNQNDLFPERGAPETSVMVETRSLSGRRLKNVSLAVRKGEVLGIGGLAGSGRSELLRILAGAQRRTAGEVLVDGQRSSGLSVTAALKQGVALVPEERRSQGIILSQSIGDNIAIANLDRIGKWGLTTRGRVTQLATKSIADLKIKTLAAGQPVGQLSGGNQQKVVLAKYLARNPKVLLLDEPTRGIDIGTKAEIYALIRALAAAGTAVIVVSSELPELIGLTDRIVLLHEGRVAGDVPAADTDEEELLTYCYGRAS
ncbi:sugar ABC transporter ATP-binding protein [Arthrobacter sp. C9C5]|uniref:sugar ABC transporter ATP-binding protein n=1 Tax=Arthrobacter sp. C9C5 TaxID=2735267 RepID=UPI0015847730|nr:sugar ABC transporter ATP-binding protein [Arthrobacter sp. C9C5]NUU33319.1 sugar ABC transporter ATP-binding protein [Arthrobacter sp. C9C5]